MAEDLTNGGFDPSNITEVPISDIIYPEEFIEYGIDTNVNSRHVPVYVTSTQNASMTMTTVGVSQLEGIEGPLCAI